MSEAATSPTKGYLAYEALRRAQSAQGSLEFTISQARQSAYDDKLSPETRLVMVAVALSHIDQQNDAVEKALIEAMGAVREAFA